MNYLDENIKKEANAEALFNLTLYLFSISLPKENQKLSDYIKDTKAKNITLSNRDRLRIDILNNAIKTNNYIANTIISNITYSKDGLVTAVFKKPDNSISIAFKGTGRGEWIDNGEGLSGISEENTYCSYDVNGLPISCKTLVTDFATDQQVEAYNLFLKLCAQNCWSSDSKITVSGHSKGGNKAQFIAINSDIPKRCFSFNAQGFSPEAINYLNKLYHDTFMKRQNKIYGFNSKNDYVNVFGESIIPKENLFYFNSRYGFHLLETTLDDNGKFLKQTNQGVFSKYMLSISDDLMNMPPEKRQYATLGIMNIFQKHFGKGTPVNDDKVSFTKTIAGIYVASKMLIKRFL